MAAVSLFQKDRGFRGAALPSRTPNLTHVAARRSLPAWDIAPGLPSP